MSEAAAGWTSQRLDEVAKITMGQSPPGSSYNSTGNGVPFFQGKAEFGVKHPTVKKWTTAGTKFAKAGDILMSVRAPVGPTNIADIDCAIGRGLAAITADSTKINQSYLIWFLKNIEAAIEARGKGSTFSAISGNELRETVLRFPPIDVQKRIVETLEVHLSRLDKAVAGLSVVMRQLQTYFRSFSNELLSGKVLDSSSWTHSTLGKVANWSSGGTPSSKTPAYYGGDIPWAVIGDLTEGPVEETGQSITGLGLEKSSAKIQPTGTVMLAMYGASIGRTGITSIPMATNQAIACAQVHSDLITPEYLLRFLQNQKDEFVAAGKGGAQPNISQGIIKAWELKVPPLQVQKEINQVLGTEVERVGRLSELIQSQIDQAVTLRRSLLHAAFTGQLTNEESND